MVNKKIRSISKKTIGKSVDSVADYIDIISQMVAEYFNQRYKVEKKVEDIRKATLNGLYTLKSEFIKSIVEALFLATGILSLIIGVVIILSKVVPLEYVLVGYGFLITIFVLLRIKTK